jgi:tRNA dimethylallyltransferase
MKKVKNKIVIVCGPTASGKSDLAVQIAKKYNGKVISADSRQVYKGLDIGTGKITKNEMLGIEHYLIDVENPKNKFTAERFKELGEKIIEKIVDLIIDIV